MRLAADGTLARLRQRAQRLAAPLTLAAHLLTPDGRRKRLLGSVLVLAVGLAAGVPLLAQAFSAGQPVDLAFPRVSLWRPDVVNQSLDDIARYDHVVLHASESTAIAPLKARNPDMIVLAKTSACERVLHSEPGPPPDKSNDVLLEVPSEWFLTQVGSRLTNPVNATSTTFPVADGSVFRVGDVVVIDQELAKVTAVGTSTISVRRGLIPERSPAASHVVGTRVAAVVSVWPGLVEMDISTNCPRVTVDPEVGPETWGEYNARVGASIATSAEWDGIAVDRVEGMESRYVGRPLARSIDPSRSNTPVSDNYAAFDASWEAGLREYKSLLRTRVPSDKIVFSNVAKRNFDLLNGTTLEGFPKSNPRGLTTNWPYWQYWLDGLESYLDAVQSGQQPNLSSVLTYNDDSEPTGVVFKPPSSPATDPAWKPDYRKMRLGLTTALMGDGYFDFELNTHGQGKLGLFWFDEYDNAGAGRGYLGQPLGAARLAFSRLTTRDLVGGDGAFSTTTQFRRWYTWANPGYAASQSLDGGTARINVTASTGKNANEASLSHNSVSLKSGQLYTITFRAKADRPLSITARANKRTSPFTGYLYADSIALDTTWRTYEISLTSVGTDSDARLQFGVGGKVGTIWMDDIKIQAGSRLAVYRRDFRGGVALVNASDSTAVVPLGGTFRKIRGVQVPSVNDGTYVSAVTLPPRDGIVLLRTPTISLSKGGTIRFGEGRRFTGVLKSAAGQAMAGRNVTVQYSYDKAKWTNLTAKTSGSAGEYSFDVKPWKNTYYRVRFYGDSSNLQATSASQRVLVRAKLTVPVAKSTVYRNRAFTTFGYLTPRHTAGARSVQIQCYRYESGRWVSRKKVWATNRDYSSTTTKYAASLSLPSPGRWRLRATHADSGHTVSYSGWRYLTVK